MQNLEAKYWMTPIGNAPVHLEGSQVMNKQTDGQIQATH